MTSGFRFNIVTYHSLDDRGRIVFPKKVRDQLKGDLALCFWMENCIAVLPPETQVKWEDKILSSIDISTREGRNFERVYRANYFDEIEMDKQGRVPIPSKLRDKVGLVKDVALVGMGDHLEIWDRERWNAMEEEQTALYEDNLSSLSAGKKES